MSSLSEEIAYAERFRGKLVQIHSDCGEMVRFMRVAGMEEFRGQDADDVQGIIRCLREMADILEEKTK